MDILSLAPDGGEEGGHYGPVVQIHCGLTLGDLLSPTIFNLVIDAVIRIWVTLVKGPQEGSGQEGLGTSIQTLWENVYANDGIVVLPESAHLQVEFYALTIFFYLLGL